MSNLTILGIPELVETDKDQNAKQITAWGYFIVIADMVRALLLYGTYDKYYFLWGSQFTYEIGKKRLKQYPNHERAELVLIDDCARLAQADDMVLFVPQVNMHDLQYFRRYVGRPDWPVVGMTHTLSFLRSLPHASFNLFEDLYDYDCMICTTDVARTAVKNITDRMCQHLSYKFGTQVEHPLQTSVIPLGIDTDAYCQRSKSECRARLNIAEDQTVILYIGRFSPFFKMDLLPLILTFSETVAKKDRNALLVLAGDDTVHNLSPEMMSFANDIGCAEQVRVLANISTEDKHALYSAADIFVSLSDNVQETFGLTIVEAMASGLPVIASDWDGYRESVRHGETGFLVPTYWGKPADKTSRLGHLRGDDETHWMLAQGVTVDNQVLAERLTTLVENPRLRREMGEAGRARALSHYDWRVVVKSYEELWSALKAQAAGHGKSKNEGFRHGMNSYDYADVFRHYPTEVFGPDAEVQLTTTGRQFLKRELKIKPLDMDIHPFAARLNHQIAEACDSESQIQASALIAKLSSDLQSPESVFQHVARLIKYGVLKISR